MYSYAGYDSRAAVSGVSATIAQAGPLQVRDGHVAGWVGVVDPESGAAWLQAGLSALPSDETSRIYYEVARPGHAPAYHELRSRVALGEPHRVGVLEMHGRPGWWRVWLDGRPVTEPLYLPRSHGRWTAQTLGESWAGTTSGACNLYSYSFARVSVARAGRHTPLAGAVYRDPGYRLVRRPDSSFLAASVAQPAARVSADATPTP